MSDDIQNWDTSLIPKLSPALAAKLDAAGPAPSRHRYSIIVNLEQDIEWNTGINMLQTEGMEIASQEKVILTVFGTASTDAIWRIAALPVVRLIEADEPAIAMH